MSHAIRRCLVSLLAALVAVAVLIAPANAVAADDCKGIEWSVSDEPAVLDHGSHSHADARPDMSPATDPGVHDHEHLDERCGSHSCVAAVTGPHGGSGLLAFSAPADQKPFHSSLMAQDAAEGLRRPPRS